MKKIFIPVAFAATLFFISCGKDAEKDQAQAGAQKPTLPVVDVPTRTVTAYSSFPATMEGVVNSEIRAKISGYISDVLVEEGEAVKKGQLLFKLETQSLTQDAAAARANVNAAQVEVDKLKPLVEKNIISSVQLETAKAQLQQAQSNYNSISANIDYANIKSPVDGVVGSINFRKGALVSAQDARPITTVSSIDEVFANFSMNEKEFLDFAGDSQATSIKAQIDSLPPVKLVLANGREYSEEGKIETISGAINSQTGTISFRAKFDNPNRLLRNGSSGTVKVPTTYENKVVVPVLSTFERQGKTFVYRVVSDSLVASSLSILKEVDRVYVINDGLQEGATILAKGANKVKPGAVITPKPVAIDSITNSFNTVFQ